MLELGLSHDALRDVLARSQSPNRRARARDERATRPTRPMRPDAPAPALAIAIE